MRIYKSIWNNNKKIRMEKDIMKSQILELNDTVNKKKKKTTKLLPPSKKPVKQKWQTQ